jgi:pimeloyl-ACP methyl ester carboxylesterase
MDSVRAFLEGHPVDPERVWIAGVGSGAMVAFEIALRAPGLFRGVLLVDGPIHPDTSTDQAARAASLGMRAGFVLDEGIPASRLDEGALALRLRTWLLDCGFSDPSVLRTTGPAERSERVGEILRAWNGR